MNRYVLIHRRLSVEWARLHAIAFPVFGEHNESAEGNRAWLRMVRVMHLCDRIEERLDNYSKVVQTIEVANRAAHKLQFRSTK